MMTGQDQPEEGLSDADRETMTRLTESMADLIRRMVEFQQEMEPFLPLLAEAEPTEEAEDEERPQPRGEAQEPDAG